MCNEGIFECLLELLTIHYHVTELDAILEGVERTHSIHIVSAGTIRSFKRRLDKLIDENSW